jgi:hypothetical protein
MIRKLKIPLKIFLIVVIPLIVMGFNIFERTPIYKHLIGTAHVERAVKTRLLTQYDKPGQLILKRGDDQNEFDSVWRLIRANTSAKLPDKLPHLISRVAVENGAFVTLPTGRKAVLIPEATPLFAFFCPRPTENCPDHEAIMVGSVGELGKWAQEREKTYRLARDVSVSFISIFVGLLLERKNKRRSDWPTRNIDQCITTGPTGRQVQCGGCPERFDPPPITLSIMLL